MIKQKIQSPKATEGGAPRSSQEVDVSASTESKPATNGSAAQLNTLDAYLTKNQGAAKPSLTAAKPPPAGNGECRDQPITIELSDSEDSVQEPQKPTPIPETSIISPLAEPAVLSSQSTPPEAEGEGEPDNKEKPGAAGRKAKTATTKAKPRKKAVPSKDTELKREAKKKQKEEESKAKEERRRLAEEARQEAKKAKEKEKAERKQKREQEQKQKREREEQVREKRKEERREAQNAKNTLANKLKAFAKAHPECADDNGHIKYPVPDELIAKYPHISIRGQKGKICAQPEPTDLGFVHPMAFQIWINLSNFTEYLELETFSLQAFHEALAFEREDDVPLLSEIIKALLLKIISWTQEQCEQSGCPDFFDDKDRGKLSLLKNYFKEIERLRKVSEEKRHHRHNFECKVLDAIWPEVLQWVLGSEVFRHFRDQHTLDIVASLRTVQNPREFMMFSYHFKVLSLVFLLKVVMSRSQFRNHLSEILQEKSDLVQAKQKKQKEQKELAQVVQELTNLIKSKNQSIKQLEKQLEQKTLLAAGAPATTVQEESSSTDPLKSSSGEPSQLVLDRQESIRVRRQITYVENEVGRLIRRRNDQERRMANLANAVNSIEARLNGIKMRQTPLCTDHQGKRYWYFEHDSCRLYVQQEDELGYFHKSSQFHNLVRSYDECGIKQRRVLEELRRVAGLLDMQDDDGLTPMKSHSRFIEKQVAGQDEQEEEEDEEEEEEVQRELEYNENVEEKKGQQEVGEAAAAAAQKPQEKSKSDYLSEALQFMVEENSGSTSGKYFTRRGGESHAVREFCVVYKLERAKEFVQDMELRFNQAVNNFLASKWGQTGERLEWRKRLFDSESLFEMALLVRELDAKIQVISPIDERVGDTRRNSKKGVRQAKLWSGGFTRPNRAMWGELVTEQGSKRLGALVFAINILDALIANFIEREQAKYMQAHPEQNRRHRNAADFDQFSYFSRGLGAQDKVGDAISVRVPGMPDGVENVGGYKMRNRSATRRAIQKAVQKEDINWEDECVVCGDGGEVMCCEDCPTVAHVSCLGFKHAPTTWLCDDCDYAHKMRQNQRRMVIEDSD